MSTFPGASANDTIEGSSFASVLTTCMVLVRKSLKLCLIGHLLKLFIAALLALYGAHPGMPPVAAPELIKMTLPFDSLKAGREALMAGTSENKLTSKWRIQLSRLISGLSMRPKGSRVAALRINPSICPKWSFPRAIALCRALSSVLLSFYSFSTLRAHVQV